MSLKTEYTISLIIGAYDVLAKERDLSPRNNKITQVLTALVGSLSDEYSPAEEAEILSDQRVQDVRAPMLEKLAQAEGDMEKFWAEHFLSKEHLDLEDLKEFWYWQNYEDLVDGEIPHMKNFRDQNVPNNDNHHVAFIGSGPLPLTAIIRHLKTGVHVTCIDNDPVACRQSRVLLSKLGLSDKIKVVEGDGAKVNYSKFSNIVIAALVPNKAETINRIRETAQHTTQIGIRSAERLHSLLYDPLDEEMSALQECALTSRTPHDPRVINTTVFYEAPPKTQALALPKAKKKSCGNCNRCGCIPKFGT